MLVLSDVLDALSRQHTIAVICAHLQEYVATAFRGDDARGPIKLLRTPDGSARRADVDDVLVIESMLASIVDTARRELARLQSARVLPDDSRGSQKKTQNDSLETSGDVVDEVRITVKRGARPPRPAP